MNRQQRGRARRWTAGYRRGGVAGQYLARPTSPASGHRRIALPAFTLSLVLLLVTTAFPLRLEAQPNAVVIGALGVPADGVDPGEILLGELKCAACHRAKVPTVARLIPKAAPLLGEAGRRITEEYLRAFIANPLAEKPGTTMPELFHGLSPEDRSDQVEALVHFLRSLSAPMPAESTNADLSAIALGRVLYHRLGCVACHPPREAAVAVFPNVAAGGATDAEAAQFIANQLNRNSVPLGNLAKKHHAAELAQFLLDPVKVRPSGRMPSLNLTAAEATAISLYLLRDEIPGPPKPPPDTNAVDAGKAARGKELFVSLGCAACHELGPNQPALLSTLKAKPLASLAPNDRDGCLSAQPAVGVPLFHLNDSQRTALRATLANGPQLTQPLQAKDKVNRTLVAFNCFACHSRDGVGGPTPSRSDYFTVLSEAELGDEGRLPPHLTGVGNKLRPDWLREVLLNQGTVRPYMATRMPQYGAANVESLLTAFERVDVAGTPLPPAPSVPDAAKFGRQLVGVGGYSCVSCHRFAQFKSLGISIMDLTQTPRRLNKDWFRRYVVDPPSLRPGTRMPSFFPDGKPVLGDILGGDTDRQIEAIWVYLSQGSKAEPPPGLSQ